jgi:hypothetical protein
MPNANRNSLAIRYEYISISSDGMTSLFLNGLVRTLFIARGLHATLSQSEATYEALEGRLE